MLTAYKYIDCGCNPPNKYWEKTISSNICCFPPRVIFVFVFILQRSLINSDLLFYFSTFTEFRLTFFHDMEVKNINNGLSNDLIDSLIITVTQP